MVTRTWDNDLQWRVADEGVDSQRRAGRFSPARELHWQERHRVPGTHRYEWREYSCIIGAGRSDEVDVERRVDTGRVYVLSVNRGLGYVGLEVLERGERVGGAFFQNDPAEILGRRWEDLRPRTLIQRMREYADD